MMKMCALRRCASIPLETDLQNCVTISYDITYSTTDKKKPIDFTNTSPYNTLNAGLTRIPQHRIEDTLFLHLGDGR